MFHQTSAACEKFWYLCFSIKIIRPWLDTKNFKGNLRRAREVHGDVIHKAE